MSAATATADSAAVAGKASKPKSPMMLVLISAMLSAGMAAGAVFFVTAKQQKAAAAAAEEDAGEADEHGGGASEHGGGSDHGGGASHGSKAGKGASNYFSLTPTFVVNLNDPDGVHYLQVEMEVAARDAAVGDAIKTHMPRIRNAILLLLGSQKSADIETREAKEALQKKVLEEIRKILTEATGKPGAEAVYFDSFVVQ